jgi:hypothetical protein
MKVAERKRASPVKQGVRTAFPRGRSWLLIGVLLLLPIGIGIGIRQSRSVNSGAKEQSGRETPIAPAREEQAELSTAEVAAAVANPEGNRATGAISTDQHSRTQLQNQGAVPAEANSHARLSSKSLSSPSDPIAISKITPALVPSPIYKLFAGPEKRFQPRNWLEVEVEFSVRKRVPGGAVFRFGVQMNGTLFTGDVAVAPLEKEDGLVTVAYLSPNSLRRAFHGREPNFDSGLRIEIAILSGEEMIGSAVYGKTKAIDPIEQQFEQTVRPKSDTPFAPLYWDRYVEPAAEPSSETSGREK